MCIFIILHFYKIFQVASDFNANFTGLCTNLIQSAYACAQNKYMGTHTQWTKDHFGITATSTWNYHLKSPDESGAWRRLKTLFIAHLNSTPFFTAKKNLFWGMERTKLHYTNTNKLLLYKVTVKCKNFQLKFTNPLQIQVTSFRLKSKLAKERTLEKMVSK